MSDEKELIGGMYTLDEMIAMTNSEPTPENMDTMLEFYKRLLAAG